MNLRVNGEDYVVEGEITVLGLLIEQGVKSPEMVSVQLNNRFVDTKDFGTTVLKENDQIDHLYFVGNGRDLQCYHGFR